MSASRRLLWGMGLALVFLAGVGFEKAFAQPQQKLDWMQEEATLPPDIHPETLSRMPRSKESDFTNDDDKAAFARANRRGTGTRRPFRGGWGLPKPAWPIRCMRKRLKVWAVRLTGKKMESIPGITS